MKTEKINIRFVVLTVIVLLAALSRLLPHPYNFTPIGAMALFGAAYFCNRILSFIVPLVSMWISDLIINNIVYAQYQESFVWFTEGFYWMYGSFLLIGVLGHFTLKNIKPATVIGSGLAASIIFFLITNFGVWASGLYPATIEGLMTSYAAGVPFFGNTLAGDLFYCTVLFGAYELARKRYFVLQQV